MKIAEFKALKFGTEIINILNVMKVMIVYIQEPWLKILGFVVSWPYDLFPPPDIPGS